MAGWIKLHRQITTWEWYDDANTFRLFMHLLLMANHKDGNWRGIPIKRGQHLTGRKTLAKALKLGERSIRVSLNKLKTTNEVTIQATNRYSIVTITNYNAYNDKETCSDQPNDQRSTNERPASDQQTTTNKNEKNENNEEEEKEKYVPDCKEMQLSLILYSLMKANNEKTKQPNMQQWCKDINLLYRVDGNSYDDIEKVIRWTQQDNFEMKNVLSPSKLRKRFADLWMKAKGSNGSSNLTDEDIDKAFEL